MPLTSPFAAARTPSPIRGQRNAEKTTTPFRRLAATRRRTLVLAARRSASSPSPDPWRLPPPHHHPLRLHRHLAMSDAAGDTRRATTATLTPSPSCRCAAPSSPPARSTLGRSNRHHRQPDPRCRRPPVVAPRWIPQYHHRLLRCGCQHVEGWEREDNVKSGLDGRPRSRLWLAAWWFGLLREDMGSRAVCIIFLAAVGSC
jgi:hypothetical protein